MEYEEQRGEKRMNKFMPSELTTKSKFHKIIVAKDGDFCCYISIDGMQATERDPFACISIGSLTYFPHPDYCRTLRGRLYTMWNALRGRLWGYDIDLLTKADHDRFMTAMKEMGEVIFPDERQKG